MALFSRIEDGGAVSTDDSLRSHLDALQTQLVRKQAPEDGQVDGPSESARGTPVASLAGETGDRLVDFLE